MYLISGNRCTATPKLRPLAIAAMLFACAPALHAAGQDATQAPPASPTSEARKSDAVNLDTITVVGSSIKVTAASVDTMSQPIQFISEEQFARTPGESVGDFLRKLPINTGESESPQTDEYGGGNSSINLRGVGSSYTLVLVDGRRFGGEDVPDIGAIPAEAIKSIEILKGGASSIYGSDAIAGVVNIRLKDNYQGLEIHSSYGDTTRQDQQFVRTAALFGLKQDKFSLTGSLSYQRREDINKFDRELTASRDYRRFGGLDRRSGRVSTPHQIVRSSAPGSPLSLDITRFGPGQSSTNINDFVPFNRDAQAYSTNEYGTSPAFDRLSGHWSASYEFIEDKLIFFTRGYVDHRNQEFLASQAMVDVNVPANNPYNPFGEAVRVWYLFGIDEHGLITEDFKTTNLQGTAGFKGTLGRYNYEIGVSGYQKTVRERYRNDIDVNLAAAAAARTDLTAFNPFSYWGNSAEQLAGISPTSRYTSRNKVRTLDAKVDGELFDWSAGTAFFAVGAERRYVETSYDPDAAWQQASYWWLGNGGTPTSRNRDVTAYFGEVRVPLYDAGMEPAFFQTAEITGAVRREKYSDYGSSTVGQFSARVGLLDEKVVLRASYAESFKAPSLSDLNAPVSYGTEPGGFYYDPAPRGPNGEGGFFPVDRITGGSLDLQPEKGETVNVGVIFRPDASQRLVFTLDWWKLKLTDLILSPDGQALLYGTGTSGSITRDPVTLYPTLDLRLDNGGTREVSGIDVGASYQLPTERLGDFTFDVNGTYLTKFEDSADGVSNDYLDLWSGAVGPVPKLRVVTGAQWTRGAWDASTSVNFSDGYRDIIPNVLSRRVSSYTTLDLQASYTFGRDESSSQSLFKGTSVYVGIENLFNADLPFVASSSDGWDRYIADYRGRYAYVGLKVKF